MAISIYDICACLLRTAGAELGHGGAEQPLLAVTVDLGWLFKAETDELYATVSATTGVSAPRLLISLSHTHAGPSMTRPFQVSRTAPAAGCRWRGGSS